MGASLLKPRRKYCSVPTMEAWDGKSTDIEGKHVLVQVGPGKWEMHTAASLVSPGSAQPGDNAASAVTTSSEYVPVGYRSVVVQQDTAPQCAKKCLESVKEKWRNRKTSRNPWAKTKRRREHPSVVTIDGLYT